MSEKTSTQGKPAAEDAEQHPASGEEPAAGGGEATQPEPAAAQAPEAPGPGEAEGGAQPEAPADGTVEALKAEIESLNDRLLRAVAETENVRRRAQRDKDDTARYAIANFARDMLSVADNLRRALDSIDQDLREKQPQVDALVVGIEMTERELLAIFERNGIRRMEPLDKPFDPNFHEAMFEYEDKEKPAGHVGQVLETGYMLHDRPLRPAKVGVTKGGPKAAPEAPAEAAGGDGPAAEETQDETAGKEGRAAYESKAGGPGGKLDEKL